VTLSTRDSSEKTIRGVNAMMSDSGFKSLRPPETVISP